MILIYFSRSPKLFSVYDVKIETAFSLSAILDPIEGIFAPKGPSKNYVTARGGKGIEDFVTYRYVYFVGRGVFFEIVT